MIGYVTVGCNDMDKGLPFYDGLMLALGLSPAFDHPRGGRFYGAEPGKMEFGVLKPFDESTATSGNGTMIAFQGESHEQVRAVHAKALELGGTCEGEPGYRGKEGGFFGAYFRDLDGNKLCVFRIGPE